MSTTLDPDNAAKLRGRVNRFLRDQGAGYLIGEDEGGAGFVVETPRPAFKFRRSSFRRLPKPVRKTESRSWGLFRG